MPQLLAAVILALSSLGITTQADPPGVTLSTPYPAQVVRAGESISLSIKISNTTQAPQVVALEVQDVPEGWRANFQGGGRVVRAVYVEAEDDRTLTLKVEVGQDATDGTYRLVAVAKNGISEARLPIELIVGEAAPPQFNLDVDLPVLKGSPNSKFSYRLKIKNDSDEDMLVNLEADAPQSFDVTFKKAYGSQELTSIPVKAGQEESVDVSVQPIGQIPAGTYLVRVRALAGDLAEEIELTAVVSGKPDLTLTTPDGRLSGRATAGRASTLELVLRNRGTAPAESVRLEASPPARWEVTFEPEKVDLLQPDDEVQVTVKITPPEEAVAGDYIVTMRAIPENGAQESSEFRITVMTSTLWGVVGLVLIAAALGVVALAVARFGRR